MVVVVVLELDAPEAACEDEVLGLEDVDEDGLLAMADGDNAADDDEEDELPGGGRGTGGSVSSCLSKSSGKFA